MWAQGCLHLYVNVSIEYLSRMKNIEKLGTDSSHAVLLTIKEVCEVLRISRATLYRFFQSRRLKRHRLGSRRFVSKTELERFLKSTEESVGSHDGVT